MSTLQRAIEIATLAHQGQVDKSGNDYIGHPLRVMEMGKTEDERIVGVLHDVVEDTEWTFEALQAEGFSQEIIDALMENLDPETAEEFEAMSAEELLAEIRESIQDEFRTASQDMRQVMYGILAKCRIEGCDCHAISPEGKILAHYETGRPIPENLAKGRGLFERFPECKCIEVYRDCCRVVMRDSSVIRVQD
jgi:DNA-binding transcriptional MerR regulator